MALVKERWEKEKLGFPFGPRGEKKLENPVRSGSAARFGKREGREEKGSCSGLRRRIRSGFEKKTPEKEEGKCENHTGKEKKPGKENSHLRKNKLNTSSSGPCPQLEGGMVLPKGIKDGRFRREGDYYRKRSRNHASVAEVGQASKRPRSKNAHARKRRYC